jgi:protein-disulfide isomerase
LIAPLVARGVFAIYRRLPRQLLARQIATTPGDVLDLVDDVDPGRDHIRGPDDAPVTLLEYGDFECPYCGQAEGVIRELLASFGNDVRYVWRHLPLNDVHVRAQLAAEAVEAAASQGRFWEMYDAMLAHQDDLTAPALSRLAGELNLDVDRFWDEVRRHDHAPRVAEDVASADASGVSGTPTFFVNGRRHYGAYDVDTLADAVRSALRQATVRSV